VFSVPPVRYLLLVEAIDEARTWHSTGTVKCYITNMPDLLFASLNYNSTSKPRDMFTKSALILLNALSLGLLARYCQSTNKDELSSNVGLFIIVIALPSLILGSVRLILPFHHTVS
jgi:hypothetical protein